MTCPIKLNYNYDLWYFEMCLYIAFFLVNCSPHTLHEYRNVSGKCIFSTCFRAVLESQKIFWQMVHSWAFGPFSGYFWIYTPKLEAPSEQNTWFSWWIFHIKLICASLKNDDSDHFLSWRFLYNIYTDMIRSLENEYFLHASSGYPCHFLVSHRLCTCAFWVHSLDLWQCTHRKQSCSVCLQYYIPCNIWASNFLTFVIHPFSLIHPKSKRT